MVRRYLQAAYRIPKAAAGARDLTELFARLHAIIRDLMAAENLYFAFWDRATDTVSFPYWSDAVDPAPPSRSFRRGLTEFVLRTGRPLLADADVLADLEASGEVECIGTDPLAWLGAPLEGDQGVFGALVVQIYGTGAYTPEERDLLVFVSGQAAMVLERWRIEAEQRIMSAALDRSADPVYGIDEAGRFLFVNQAACNTLGYPREALLAMGLPDIDPHVGYADWGAMWGRARHNLNYRGEAVHRRQDGTTFPVEISASFLAFEGREAIFATARDISGRKAAEQALRISEEKFSKAFQASPDAININRLDGTYLDVNPAFTTMSGWTREEALGRTTLDLGLWADPADRARMQEQLRAKGHFIGLEAPFRIKDGSIRTGLVSGTLIQVEGETCLLTITRDITERQEAEQALRIAERRLRTVLANSQAIIYQLGPEGRFQLSEGLGLAEIGLRPGEVVGQSALELYGTNPVVIEQLDRALRGQGSQRTVQVMERVFDNLLTPVFDEAGRLESVIGIATDITERRQAEEALRHSQKLESLGVLAGGIAHDFNNLLTVVLGNLNLAQMHLREDSPAGPYLANVEATILRATELTKQMLAYSGRGHFLIKPHDLNAVVRDLVHLLEVTVSKKIHLRVELEADLPAIQADAAQIQQVVMNLVTNASDAIGDREGVVHLSTGVRVLDEAALQAEFQIGSPSPGRHVILEVEDTGCGMTRDVLERIFDPFFTTKVKGRGLGLSAMLGILRGHGAGLHISSEVGRGSRFRICFPASDGPADPHPAQEPAASGAPLKGLVLLVDDEERILEATGSALAGLGFQVLVARDGLEALDRFREAGPELDLVLMDLTMPRMDGREAFRAMQELDPRVPVILSSGFTEQDSLQTLPGGGPAAFLQKPYQLKDMGAVIRRVLGT
jgi:PAS domain S-box-containing protein